ncbi:hypothetical protein MKW92_035956, partial [Papaver armeniacum]
MATIISTMFITGDVFAHFMDVTDGQPPISAELTPYDEYRFGACAGLAKIAGPQCEKEFENYIAHDNTHKKIKKH